MGQLQTKGCRPQLLPACPAVGWLMALGLLGPGGRKWQKQIKKAQNCKKLEQPGVVYPV